MEQEARMQLHIELQDLKFTCS